MRFCSYYEFSALSGKTFGFHKQNSILGGLRRKIEVRGNPGHQEQGYARKRAKHGRASRPHGRAPEHQARPAGQQLGTGWPCLVARLCHVARSGRAKWHGRATWWPAAVKSFAILFFRGCLISAFFLPCFSSCF